MSDQHWTDETERLVANALEDVQPPDSDISRPDEAFFADARRVLAVLSASGLLLPPGVISRNERGRVYQDGLRLPIEAVRTVWETPWLPDRIAEWERELLEAQANDR